MCVYHRWWVHLFCPCAVDQGFLVDNEYREHGRVDDHLSRDSGLSKRCSGNPNPGTSSWCGVTEKTSDGFVALRKGPSPKFEEVSGVIPSDALTLDTGFCRSFMGKSYCDFSDNWVFVELITKLDGSSIVGGGWANSRYIRQVACDVPWVRCVVYYTPCRRPNPENRQTSR